MGAKILGFGERSRRAVRAMDAAGARATVENLLELGASIERGKIAHVVVIAADVDGKPQGFASYNPDEAASVLKSLTHWRQSMVRTYHGERD